MTLLSPLWFPVHQIYYNKLHLYSFLGQINKDFVINSYSYGKEKKGQLKLSIQQNFEKLITSIKYM